MKRTQALFAFTGRALSSALLNFTHQVTYVDLSNERFVILSGVVLDLKGRVISDFTVPIRPSEFKGMVDKYTTTLEHEVDPPLSDVKTGGEAVSTASANTDADVTSTEPKKRRRRQKHPITGELVEYEVFRQVKDAIRRGGAEYEAKLIAEHRAAQAAAEA